MTAAREDLGERAPQSYQIAAIANVSVLIISNRYRQQDTSATRGVRTPSRGEHICTGADSPKANTVWFLQMWVHCGATTRESEPNTCMARRKMPADLPPPAPVHTAQTLRLLPVDCTLIAERACLDPILALPLLYLNSLCILDFYSFLWTVLYSYYSLLSTTNADRLAYSPINKFCPWRRSVTGTGTPGPVCQEHPDLFIRARSLLGRK